MIFGTVSRCWRCNAPGNAATKVKPDCPSAELKISVLAIPKNPAEAGPQHCDFEAGSPGGRHEGIRRSIFRRYRLKLLAIFPSNSLASQIGPAQLFEVCFPGLKTSVVGYLRFTTGKEDVQDNLLVRSPRFRVAVDTEILRVRNRRVAQLVLRSNMNQPGP